MITCNTHCYYRLALALVILIGLAALPNQAMPTLLAHVQSPDMAWESGAALPNTADLPQSLPPTSAASGSQSGTRPTLLTTPTLFAPNGIQGSDGYRAVQATLVHNGNLYVGGHFSHAGGVPANNIARWDGTSWHALGSGVRFLGGGYDPSRVQALAAIGNDLYVGGSFSDAGGVPAHHIARWDGTNWHRLTTGIASDSFSPSVTALAVSGMNLFVGGTFSSADGLPTANIARWDGANWHALGAGVDRSVYTMAVTQGKLFVGGYFDNAGGAPASRVAQWDGTAWSTLGSGLGGQNVQANSMLISGTDVLVGGVFSTAGDLPAAGVARWDGTAWHVLGSGVEGLVQAMTIHDGSLFVATMLDSSHRSRIERWDSMSWNRTGGDANELIMTLTAFGGDLVAGGSFRNIGAASLNGLALWRGDAWHTIGNGNGLNGAVEALLVNGNDIYAGGNFTGAGEVQASNIARWDGTRWHALGAGVNGKVRALALMGSNLFVGGEFEQAGGQPARAIARWDGSAWHNLSVGAEGPVYALAVQGNTLFAGGSFNSIGGLPAKNVARWDGSEWSALGSGLEYAPVTALIFHGGDLIAGGSFQHAGDQPVRGTARWDGAQWHQIGDGTSAYPGQLVSFKGALYRSMIYSKQILRWDGSTWSALDPGLPGLSNPVTAMTADADMLYIALTVATGSSLARYDDTSWRQLHMQMSGATSALGASGTALFIGGAFLQAGGQPSGNIAYWTPAMEPQLGPAVWLPLVKR